VGEEQWILERLIVPRKNVDKLRSAAVTKEYHFAAVHSVEVLRVDNRGDLPTGGTIPQLDGQRSGLGRHLLQSVANA
jgi:hypothetical protein